MSSILALCRHIAGSAVFFAPVHRLGDAERGPFELAVGRAERVEIAAALEGYADLLSEAVVLEIRSDCATLRRILEGGGDLDSLRAAYSKLEGAAFRIAESMYGGEEDGGSGDMPA